MTTRVRDIRERIAEPVITGSAPVIRPNRVRMVREQVAVPTEVPGVVSWAWIERPESYDEWDARMRELDAWTRWTTSPTTSAFATRLLGTGAGATRPRR